MTDPAAALDRLHAIADELARRGDSWFAQCLSQLEAGAGLEAFGLVGGWRSQSRARRDRIIREIAAGRYPARSARAFAEIVMRRSDLRDQIGGRVTFDVIRRALAHSLTRNAPAFKTGSAHVNTGTGTSNE